MVEERRSTEELGIAPCELCPVRKVCRDIVRHVTLVLPPRTMIVKRVEGREVRVLECRMFAMRAVIRWSPDRPDIREIAARDEMAAAELEMELRRIGYAPRRRDNVIPL